MNVINLKFVPNMNTYGPYMDGRTYCEGIAFVNGQARQVTVANGLGGIGERWVGEFFDASMTSYPDGRVEYKLGHIFIVDEDDIKDKMAEGQAICEKFGWTANV